MNAAGDFGGRQYLYVPNLMLYLQMRTFAKRND